MYTFTYQWDFCLSKLKSTAIQIEKKAIVVKLELRTDAKAFFVFAVCKKFIFENSYLLCGYRKILMRLFRVEYFQIRLSLNEHTVR